MSKKLYQAVQELIPLERFPWDEYFPTMAQGDWLEGSHEDKTVKSWFIRRTPFKGAYALLGGLTEALRQVNELRFDTPEFQEGMRSLGYREEFLSLLAKDQKLRIKIYAPDEGSAFFSNQPVVTVVGPKYHVRLIEGILTATLNPGSLMLTKWHRVVRAAGKGGALDFGRRRAQNSTRSSIAAVSAGCVATSNTQVGLALGVGAKGTMGHEEVQTHGDVFEAFDKWLSVYPDKPIGLVDTVRCMEIDFPAWLEAVYKHREAIKEANPPAWGWRNDSGDLSGLSVEQYAVFMEHPLASDSWFVDLLKIFNTNELDEYKIVSISGQITEYATASGFDANEILRRIVWAAGTNPAVCSDDPALGGVMKIQECRDLASIKLAKDGAGRVGIKTSIPGFNFSAFLFDEKKLFRGVVVYPAYRYSVNADGKLVDRFRDPDKQVLSKIQLFHPDSGSPDTIELGSYRLVQQQQLVFDTVDGDGFTDLWNDPTVADVQRAIHDTVGRLPRTMYRHDMPAEARLWVPDCLRRLRQAMIEGERLLHQYPSY
jgi:putative nicotinate phosphoribosyltransferase